MIALAVGPRFSLGRVVITQTAQAQLCPEDVFSALRRHASGDWGEVDAHDRAVNEAAVREGDWLFSVFRDRNRARFYIISEADRTVTTVLLPEDY